MNCIDYHFCITRILIRAGFNSLKIARLYVLLERNDVDEDTKAAIRWAIFELERK
nr:MAG TPA: hypothetical protein [Caudoviricetes sp.]